MKPSPPVQSLRSLTARPPAVPLRRRGLPLIDSARETDQLALFPTALGWMALVGAAGALKQLTFGHASPAEALAGVQIDSTSVPRQDDWNPELARRLTAFAQGAADDFADVALHDVPKTSFQRDIIRYCRRIPYGRTLTYGALAALAGCPRAARAVGNCMRTNRTPLIVPCHRVVASAAAGGYSAAEGVRMKLRLLELESRAAARSPRPR